MRSNYQTRNVADVADQIGQRPRYVRDTSAIPGTFQPLQPKDLRSMSATSAIFQTIAYPHTHTSAYAHHAHTRYQTRNGMVADVEDVAVLPGSYPVNWLPAWSEVAVTSDPAIPPTPDPPTPAAPREERVTGPSERRRLLAVVAGWPIPWRGVWGRRANDLADSGVPWPEDERQAFNRTEADREAGLDPNLILNPHEETRPCPATPRPRSLFTT